MAIAAGIFGGNLGKFINKKKIDEKTLAKLGENK